MQGEPQSAAGGLGIGIIGSSAGFADVSTFAPPGDWARPQGTNSMDALMARTLNRISLLPAEEHRHEWNGAIRWRPV